MLVEGAQLGRYTVVRTLGAGGMGEVYEATDTLLRRPIALKVLRTRESVVPGAPLKPMTQFAARLLREARAAAALRHPNAVAVYDVGETPDGTPFIAMELIEGRSLRSILEEDAPPLAAKLDWLLAIARVLSAAHDRGLVHRDIKPDNVMIDVTGVVKVLDFGIAKPIDQDELEEIRNSLPPDSTKPPASFRTEAGLVIGTPRYMAPEQAAGIALDGRVDQFAWGIMALELLSLVDPRAVATPKVVARAIELGAPEEVANAIGRAVANDADARFPTMGHLVEILEKHVDARPKARMTARVITAEIGLDATVEATPPARPSTPPDERLPPVPLAAAVTDTAHQFDTPSAAARREVTTARVPLTRRARWPIVIAAVLVAAIAMGLSFRERPRQHEAVVTVPTAATPLRVAVLPLDGLGPEDYLAVGATEELIAELAREPALRVVAHASVRRYGTKAKLDDVARELDVKLLVTGSVRQTDREVRLAIELIDPRSMTTKARHAYTFKSDELAPSLRRASREMLADLGITHGATPTTAHGTTNPAAHRAYLQGRMVWNQRTEPALKKAIEYFETATREDPGYAAAWAAIGESYLLFPIVTDMTTKTASEKALPVVEKALALDPTLSQAHAARGSLYEYEWNFEKAEASYERALANDPQNPIAHQWYAEMLMVERRFDDAVAHMTRALEIDPLSAPIHRNFGQVLLFADRFDEAKKILEKTLDLDPHQPYVRLYLGYIAIETGRYDEAFARLHDDPTVSTPLDRQLRKTNDIYVYAKKGDRERARQVAKEVAPILEADPMAKAWVAALLGDVDMMYAALEKSIEVHHRLCAFVNVLQPFAPYRDTPRFVAIADKVNLRRRR